MHPKPLQVIQDCYDLTAYLVQRVEKFPRHHRYSLGLAIESRLQTVLALLICARYGHERVASLKQANIELEVLRFQLRLAKDLRALPVTSHGHASKLIQGVGAQVGGWLKRSGGGS